MIIYRLFKILVCFIIISFNSCSNDAEEEVDNTQYECKVDTISFLSNSTKVKSDEVEVVFAVSLEGETKFFTVLEKYNTINGLITIGDKLVHINDFSSKGDKATFDFYYGENLGPFCMELFSAIPMHSHDAFNAEADRIYSSKNVGKWKVKKISTLSSNNPPE